MNIQKSEWDCVLEVIPDDTRSLGTKRFALRLGLRSIKGMRKSHWHRIRDARALKLFTSIEDVAQRTRLEDATLTRLAESGAYASLETNRRKALWNAKGIAGQDKPDLEVVLEEREPDFAGLDAFESVSWDYAHMGLSSRGHPLAQIRDELSARKLPDARTVHNMKDGTRTRYAGFVICRQRPGTAAGVVFMTLEDETGFVNVVIWSKIFEKNAVLIKSTNFLGVSGKLQVQDGVVHLIAERFWVPRVTNRPGEVSSRDFR